MFKEYGIHHHLEGRWRIGKPKEHDHWFEESFRGQECCFGFIPWFDAYVVIPPSNVEFCEESASAQAVDRLGNEGGDVVVPFGPFIYWTIVLDGLELPVLFFDKEEICSVGAP